FFNKLIPKCFGVQHNYYLLKYARAGIMAEILHTSMEYLDVQLKAKDKNFEKLYKNKEKQLLIEYEPIKRAETPFKPLRHENIVHSIDYDGKLILTGCYDKNIYIWNNKGLFI
ncbi:hypothetical protein HZS_4819, partial [Henneguya salminicola]